MLPDLDWAGQTAQCVGTRPLCQIPINPVWNPPAWFADMSSHVFSVPVLSTPMSVRFGGQIEFLGYDSQQTGDTLQLTLVWRALAKMPADYKFFVHVANAATAAVLIQQDRMPLDWQYPTSGWVPREVITDPVSLSLASLPPGDYQIRLGWYDPSSPDLPRLDAYDTAAGQTWANNTVILPLKPARP